MRPGKKLAPDTYLDFRRRLAAGEFKGQRLGQAFCNYFVITNPKLYYTESEGKAERMIREIMKDCQI